MDDTDRWPYREEDHEDDERPDEDWNPWRNDGGSWGEDMLAYLDRHHIPESSLRLRERERIHPVQLQIHHSRR
jgi:hypothetical protein